MRKLELIQFADIDLDDTTYCARLEFPDKAIEELSNSIGEHGLRNPPAYIRNGNRLSVLFGWRRTLAIQRLGWEEFDAWVYTGIDSQDAHFHNLNDNLEREDLTVLELANKVKTLRELEIPVEDIAQRINKGAQHIYDLIKLTEMEQEIQNAIHRGDITLYKAIEIFKYPVSKRLETLHQTIEDKLSVGELKRRRRAFMDREVSERVEQNIQRMIEASAAIGEELTRDEALAQIRPPKPIPIPMEMARSVWRSHKGWVVDIPADWKSRQEKNLGKTIRLVKVEETENGDLVISVRGGN